MYHKTPRALVSDAREIPVVTSLSPKSRGPYILVADSFNAHRQSAKVAFSSGSSKAIPRSRVDLFLGTTNQIRKYNIMVHL
jgi:hypothetical protein